MKINWRVGKQNWAYKNLTAHLIKEMKDDEHGINVEQQDKFDVEVLVSANQLENNKDGNNNSSRTILHLDGNRWYEQQQQ